MALQRANEVRDARKRLKQQMKTGEVRAAAVLSDPPATIHTMRAREFLRAVPKVGRVKADKIARQANLGNPQIGRLGPATRQRMTDLLP